LTVAQDEYLRGETVQAYVKGVDFMSADISIENSASQRLTISPLFITYREDLSLIYFDLPEGGAAAEYTLFVGDLQDTFTVVEGTPVLRIKPGIVILDPEDDTFSLQLFNIGDTSTSVTVQPSMPTQLHPRKDIVEVDWSQDKTVYVDYSYFWITSDMYLNFTYEDQVYTVQVIYPDLVVASEEEEVAEEPVYEGEVITEETPSEEEDFVPFVFLVEDATVTLTLEEDEARYGDLKVQNVHTEPLEGLSYYLTGDLYFLVELNVTEIPSLASGEVFVQRVWFNRGNSSRVGEYVGEIVLTDGERTQEVSVSIEVVSATEGDGAEGDVLEKETIEEYEIVYEGETLFEEERGIGVYVLGGVLILLLLILIVLVALKLQQKNEKKFKEYIEETKKKRRK